MTLKQMISPERDRIEQVASEYEARGYTVLRDASQLPDFLSPYRPDVVAISAKDNVVVEVKALRSPAPDRMVDRLASAIREQSGWRFELITIDTPESEPISLEDARRTIDAAHRLMRQRAYDAALLIGWAAAEAILRQMLTEDDPSYVFDSGSAPDQIVKTTFSRGLISRAASDVMLAAIDVRHLVAHGLRQTDPGSGKEAARSLLWAVADTIATRNATETDRTATAAVADMIRWFHAHYQTPAKHVPTDGAEGGYVYNLGGPYDPQEALWERFPDSDPPAIEDATRHILLDGRDWVRKGQY
jgi:hypothetical protein